MARERGRGSTLGRARKGAVPPPEGAVGLGEGAWRGRGTQAPGPAGASGSPGTPLGSRGWGGGAVPCPSAAAQTGAGRGAARKRGRGGGTGGGRPPGNPSLSGSRGSVRGRANPLTPWPPSGLRPRGPSGIFAPVLPGDTGGSVGPEVSAPSP